MNKLKIFRFQSTVVVGLLLLSLCVVQPFHAARAATAGTIKVVFNDKPLQFAVPPEQVDGRVLVPVRDVFEALGATVKFDVATKKIVAVQGDTTVNLQLGQTSAEINGKAQTLDVPAQSLNGSTYVPLRFVAEAMGVKVAWDAKQRTVDIRNRMVNAKDKAEMVWVAPGEFTMGSERGVGTEPIHKVILDGYWMYKNLVTVAQYKAFCAATGRAMATAPTWGLKDNHPVVNVSWNDATAYSVWADTRLPTEAQWEKAARGTDERSYPWGNDWSKTRLQASGEKFQDAGSTAPVGSFPTGASPYGCLDMAGNVFEWEADWYDEGYYAVSPVSNPTGPATGTMRAMRGGSWWYQGVTGSNIFSTWNRSRREPDSKDENYGFRCALGG